MHRFLPLLIIPLAFTFIFDYYAIIDKNKDIIVSNLIKNSISKDNTIGVNKNFNSSTVNSLYSEKLIQSVDEENIVILKPKIKAKFLEKSETINTINITQLNNSLHLISSGWQNSFSNKKIKFIKTVLPLIVFENNKILIERKKLLKIKDYLSLEKTLNTDDLKYLVVRTIYTGNKSKFNQMMMNPAIIKMTIK